MIRSAFLFALLFVVAACALFAADASGMWTASIDTPVGVQNYTYTFKVDGEKLSGTAKSNFSESSITDGTVKGDKISFIEMMKFQDMEIRVEYTGTVAGDQIKFSRKVGEFADEDFVAKRST